MDNEVVKKMGNNIEELASSLSYEIVKEVAPEELDLFDDIKEEYLKNPGAFLEKDTKKKDQLLGFGGGGAEVFVTTTILPLVLGVVIHIGKAGIETIKDEGSKAIAEWFKAKLGGKASHLSKEKLKLMRDSVYDNAIISGVKKEKASIISDAFIGKLVLIHHYEK